MVKPFLYQRVLEKIEVVSGDPYKRLSELIEDQYIPEAYGGTGPNPDPTGCVLVDAIAAQADRRAQFESEAAFVASEAERRGAAEGGTWAPAVVDGKCPISVGGTVPKELYAANAVDFSDAVSVVIKSGAVHIVSVAVSQAEVDAGGTSRHYAGRTSASHLVSVD